MDPNKAQFKAQFKAKDLALWRVGRNLRCFQSIEALLKSLLPSTKLAGSAQQIASQLAENKKFVKKASLGTLMDSYIRQVLTPKQDELSPGGEPEILVSITQSIEATPEVLTQMRSECRRLTKERNELVHSKLLAYNLDSIEGCTAFSKYLDEQYARVRELIEQLNGHAHARARIKRFIDSEEFEQLFLEQAKPN